MKILVGVDDSKHAEAAVHALGQYFKPGSTQVRLLHVLSPLTLDVVPQMARGYAPELKDQAAEVRTLLEKYAGQLRAEGYTVDTATETGDVRETILDAATRWQADLILLGCHGHKGMGRLLLGSVAESVVRQANCSVLVVRMPRSPAAD
jgi:nucleotide-binding universal stress UspA family protein